MGVYRHRKMENSYERPDETGELTRLVLERGHKRRNDSKLTEIQAPVIQGSTLERRVTGIIDEADLFANESSTVNDSN